jgi:hypothetical protein
MHLSREQVSKEAEPRGDVDFMPSMCTTRESRKARKVETRGYLGKDLLRESGEVEAEGERMHTMRAGFSLGFMGLLVWGNLQGRGQWIGEGMGEPGA